MVTIPTIDQISGTTVMNKMRSLINNYIEFGGEIANTVNYMEEVIRNLPQDVTDVYNKETGRENMSLPISCKNVSSPPAF